MNYQTLYSETIWQTLELITTYKTYIENDDLANLYKTKQLLVGNKAILNQIYTDACGFYTIKKTEYNDKKDELFLLYCDTETNGVAERRSKLDSKTERDEMNEFKIKRDKASKLLEDVRDIVIEIATLLKEKRNQETYGN